MQKPEIWKLVLAQIAPTKADPSSSDWRAYITRYIVPEVRQESTRFFGSTDCIESQNPGLDYASTAHRLRLHSFPHHNQLFTVFDKLQLTQGEIHALCKWYGTKKAREEFERKHRVKITDTTWDGVEPYQFIEPTLTLCGGTRADAVTNFVHGGNEMYENKDEEMGDSEEGEEEEAEEGEEISEASEDELQQSVGVELNERLMASAEAHAEARARGEPVTMDAEWEQWLKEAAERGIAPGVPPSMNDTSTRWEMDNPDVFVDDARNEIAALQARLPPSQQNHPQRNSSPSGVWATIRPSDIVQPSATPAGPAVESQ
ncbi:MAG: hypothetical protein Q9217_000161 [Psora testacea]